MNFEYEYDSRGNITSETRNGLKTTYAYDALGQLISVNDPHEGVVWYYKYDCGGNILEKKRYHRKADGSVGALLETIPYEYGDPNWKDKLTKYNGKEIIYDDIGNPKEDADRTYEWEAGRRLKKVTVKWKPEDGIDDGCHAETGTILKIEFSNTNLLDADVTTTIASAHVYNGGVEITSQYAESSFEWSRNSGNTTADATWNTAHKGMKSVTIKKSELSANTQFTCKLTKIQPCCGDIVVDEDGNLLYAASENGDVFFLDEDGYLCVENPKNSYKFDGADLSMDTTTSLGTVTATSWVYTASGSDKIVEFKYNAAGLRVQKDVTVDGIKTTTKYILNGKLLAELQRGNDVLKFDYDAQGRPVFFDHNGDRYAYIYTPMGDVCGFIHNTSLSTGLYGYDSFGNHLNEVYSPDNAVSNLNPFRYRMYIYDSDIKLYYLRSRFYDSHSGRFLNADQYVAGNGVLSKNAYTYCNNNFINKFDPNGCWPNSGTLFRHILEQVFLKIHAKDNIGSKLLNHWFYGRGKHLNICNDIEMDTYLWKNAVIVEGVKKTACSAILEYREKITGNIDVALDPNNGLGGFSTGYNIINKCEISLDGKYHKNTDGSYSFDVSYKLKDAIDANIESDRADLLALIGMRGLVLNGDSGRDYTLEIIGEWRGCITESDLYQYLGG